MESNHRGSWQEKKAILLVTHLSIYGSGGFVDIVHFGQLDDRTPWHVICALLNF